MAISAFAPSGNGSLLSAGTSSSRTPFNAGIGARQVRIHNAGNVTAFVAFGGSGITATVPAGDKDGNAFPIPAGAVEVLVCGQSYAAAITASGTAALYLTPGEGR